MSMSNEINEIKEAKHWVVITTKYGDNERQCVVQYRKTPINKVSNRTINLLLSSGLFELQDNDKPFNSRDNVMFLKPIYEFHGLGQKYILDIWVFAEDLKEFGDVEICGEIGNTFEILIKNANRKKAKAFNKKLANIFKLLEDVYPYSRAIRMMDGNDEIQIVLTK
jgi:hypothetical protein